MSIRIYGQRLIQTPPGLATRPTSARVREAVFNIWQSKIDGARWLDLCTGSGAMGAEALARGAREVVGIEQNAKACRVIDDNWKKVATHNQSFCVLKGNVCKQLKTLKSTFDLVYFDPPYQAQLYETVLTQLVQLELLEEDGAIAAEHHRDHTLPHSLAQWSIAKRRDYGQTSVSFYQRHNRANRT